MADYWTISTLSQADGIGKFHAKTRFFMPPNQMGASSTGRFLGTTGGDEPIWASPNSENYNYTIQPDGYFHVEYDTYAAGGCTNGTSGNGLRFVLPYIPANMSGGSLINIGRGTLATTNVDLYLQLITSQASQALFYTAGFISANGFTDGGDDLCAYVTLKAF